MKLATFTLCCGLLLSGPATGRAQTAQCAATLAQLPAAAELFGLRPGLTLGQVQTMFPRLATPPADGFSVVKTSINPENDPTLDRVRLRGVRTLAFSFYEGRLYSYGIGYNSDFKWQTLEEFLPGLNQALQLPDAWARKSWRGLELDCADFRATARLIAGSPSLLLVDKPTQAALNRRIAAHVEHTP